MTTSDDREEEFRIKLEALVREYVDVTGPLYVDDDGVELENQPHDQMLMNEWVFISTWMDMENGRYFIRGMTQDGMPQHHQMGLLMKFLGIVEDEG